MIVISRLEGRNASNASIEAQAKKSSASKISLRTQKSIDETSARPKSSCASEEQRPKKSLRVRGRTVEECDLGNFPIPSSKNAIKKNPTKFNTSEASLREKTNETEAVVGQKSTTIMGISQKEKLRSKHDLENKSSENVDELKKKSIQKKPSEPSNDINNEKLEKMGIKKHSEIPKLKSVPLKGNSGNPSKITTNQSKLPVKMTAKDSEVEKTKPPEVEKTKPPEVEKTKPPEVEKTKPPEVEKTKHPEVELVKTQILTPEPKIAPKIYRGKRDKLTENVNAALKDDFTNLVPLYETELKKITEVWVNTIYCSLTMRTNLVKLLFQAFPFINRSQFQMEDEKILHCIAHAKNYTKSEADSLIQFIRTLIANREKTKEQCANMMVNRDIAEFYNYDWRRLNRRIAELGEEAKQFQLGVPQLQKKNEVNEEAQTERIHKMEDSLAYKDEEILKLSNQLKLLKQKESTYRSNVLLKVQDFKDIKEDVMTLKAMEKEFENLKSTFGYQNEIHEKKIKDLEFFLEDKKKVLEKERNFKKQLQTFLEQLQADHQKLTKEQIDYTTGRTDKQRDQLWAAAVKLVLRGFLIQMKKLERDRNKMLLELQSNDSENLNALATFIMNKDNFIKSIKHQMNVFQKVCK